MALANYTDLQTSVASFLHRSDLTAIIPDLITLAEHDIYVDLDSTQQDSIATLSTLAATETLALPDDFIKLRSIALNTTGRKLDLDYVTPKQYQEQSATSQSGEPQIFTIIGSNLYLFPIPDAVYSVSLVYQAKVPALSASGTNWLMTKFPAVYLYGALKAAAPYLKNDARLPMWEAMYNKAIQGLNAKDWGPVAVMRVRTDVQQ
jgi:hypothetical protein